MFKKLVCQWVNVGFVRLEHVISYLKFQEKKFILTVGLSNIQ